VRRLDQAGVETVAGVDALDDSAQASPTAPPPVMLARERPGIAEDALAGRPSDPARVHMGGPEWHDKWLMRKLLDKVRTRAPTPMIGKSTDESIHHCQM
jgi:hypothetical protein